MSNGINTLDLLRRDSEGKRKLCDVLGTEVFTSYSNIVDHINSQPNEEYLNTVLLGDKRSELADRKCRVYEFPTYELVHTLYKIGECTRSKICHEMFAGTGILSRAIMNYGDSSNGYKFKKILCTDGRYEWDTCGYSFCDVDRECFFKLISSVRQADQAKLREYKNSMFIFSWMEHEYVHMVDKFLKYVKPRCLVVIDNSVDKAGMVTPGYSYRQFSVKQLCYRDNKSNFGVERPEDMSSHSNVGVYYRSRYGIMDDTVPEECLLKTDHEITYKSIVEDYRSCNPEQRDACDYILKNPLAIKLVIENMMELSLTSIPTCVKTGEDFRTYLQMANVIGAPLAIHTKEDLYRLKDVLDRYVNCTAAEFNKGKEDGTFPKWLDRDNIINYLVCEYVAVKKDSIFRADN